MRTRASAPFAAATGLLTIVAAGATLAGSWSQLGVLDRTFADVAGLVLIVAGVNAAVHVGIWASSRRRAEEDPLGRGKTPTDGPYALTRRPLLACGLLALTGAAMLLPSVPVLIGSAVTAALTLPRL